MASNISRTNYEGSKSAATPAINAARTVKEIVGGDKITVGDIKGSYAAIGAGAQVNITKIQQATSAIHEMESLIQKAERTLAAAIQSKIDFYTNLIEVSNFDSRKNPYKDLLEYKLEDAPFFYGRFTAIEQMLEKMQQNKLTVLESDSGSGKTSLLQAGLASRLLANGDFPLYIRPYDRSPNQEIRRAFLPDYMTQPDISRYRDDNMTLRGFLKRITFYLGGQTLYIFLDQFEEFFTVLQPAFQQQFVKELQDCISSDLRVHWVLSLRKEYLSELRIFESVNPFSNKYFLPTFSREEAQEVMEKPADLKGVSFAENLVNRIIDDLHQQASQVSPTQTQLVCHTLFDELMQEPNPELFTHALYDKRRGVGEGASGAKGILNNHLLSVLNILNPPERQLAKLILEALVNSKGQRVLVSLTDLQNSLMSKDNKMIEAVVKVLLDKRLIRRETDENGTPLYELTHDYLLAEIELDPETKARKAIQELLRRAVPEWEARGRLLSESDLQMVNAFRDRMEFSDRETIIIYASSIGYGEKENSDYWRGQLRANEAKSVLLTLSQSQRAFVRIEAATKLIEFNDDDAAEQLAALAVTDDDDEVREMATIAITESNHSAAIEQVVGMALDSTTVSNAESALVTIRDGITAVSNQLPISLAKRIRRKVWKRRWKQNKYRCYAAAWRGALGGFLGFGIGMGPILVAVDMPIEKLIFDIKTNPSETIAIMLAAMVLFGTVGGLVLMGGGFSYSILKQLFDGRLKQHNWIISSTITSFLFGFSMILFSLFSSPDKELALYFQALLAGLLIGGVNSALSTIPIRLKPFLQRTVTIICGVLVFLVIGNFEPFHGSDPALRMFAGITTAAGFFWAFNHQMRQRPG